MRYEKHISNETSFTMREVNLDHTTIHGCHDYKKNSCNFFK